MSVTLDRPAERWRLSKNPYTLARLVKQSGVEGKRKYRLLSAAFCRRVWEKLDGTKRHALEVIERYADREAKYNEMCLAVSTIRVEGNRMQPLLVEAARRDAWSGVPEVIGELLGTLWGSRPDDLAEEYNGHAGTLELGWFSTEKWKTECARMCQIVRESFGNVFEPVAIDRSWRTSTALGLAEAAYQHRDPSEGTLEPIRLAVLADALQDAGCDSATLLDHLRGPGPHVRGCWALDLVLEKPA